MMVRLEAGKYGTTIFSTFLFQFHDGAIGRATGQNTFSATSSFQFHDGAIGRNQRRIVECSAVIFQFHDGAIGSTAAASEIGLLSYFNSMMVRLEV